LGDSKKDHLACSGKYKGKISELRLCRSIPKDEYSGSEGPSPARGGERDTGSPGTNPIRLNTLVRHSGMGSHGALKTWPEKRKTRGRKDLSPTLSP